MTTENDTAPPICALHFEMRMREADPTTPMDMNTQTPYSPGASTQCASSDSEGESYEILRVYQSSDNLEAVERQVQPLAVFAAIMAAEADEAADKCEAARAAAAAAHAEAERATENHVRVAANAVRLAAAVTAWDMQLDEERATARSLDEAVDVAYAEAAAAVAAAELFLIPPSLPSLRFN